MTTTIEQTELLTLLRQPERRDEGFRRLMAQYGQQLYWHIRRIVVGHDDAEDVLQETCLKLLGGLDSFRGDSRLTTWMYTIATHEALSHLRRQTRWLQRVDDLAPRLTDKMEAETPMDASATELLFQKALLTLPTAQRIAFNMRYYDDMSYEEIAAVTGKSVATLKTNYHYATERIKKYIQQHSV